MTEVDTSQSYLLRGDAKCDEELTVATPGTWFPNQYTKHAWTAIADLPMHVYCIKFSCNLALLQSIAFLDFACDLFQNQKPRIQILLWTKIKYFPMPVTSSKAPQSRKKIKVGHSAISLPHNRTRFLWQIYTFCVNRTDGNLYGCIHPSFNYCVLLDRPLSYPGTYFRSIQPFNPISCKLYSSYLL